MESKSPEDNCPNIFISDKPGLCKTTPDKEAIFFELLREKYFKECTNFHNGIEEMCRVDMNPHNLFEWFKSAIDEHTAELRKANDKMGKILMERDGEIEQLKEDIAKLQSTNEYWKQRCEAAEENIRTYSEWHTETLTIDGTHENAHKQFIAWEEAFKKWQQLKNQELK